MNLSQPTHVPDNSQHGRLSDLAPVLPPLAGLYLVRSLQLAVVDAASLEALVERSDDRLRRFAVVTGVLTPPTADSTLEGLVDDLREAEARLLCAFASQSSDRLTADAEALSESAAFNACEEEMLKLALHAHASVDLRRCLDLTGKTDDLSLASIFAYILGLEESEVLAGFKRRNPFRRLDCCDIELCVHTPSAVLRLPDDVAKTLATSSDCIDAVATLHAQSLTAPTPPPQSYQAPVNTLALVARFLCNASAQRQPGVNVLLVGATPDEASDAARTMGSALGGHLLQVRSHDEHGNRLFAWQRLLSFTTTQQFHRDAIGTQVMLGDAGPILEDWKEFTGYSRPQLRKDASGDRGLADLLASNPSPAIWTCGRGDPLDPKLLSLFDMVVEVDNRERTCRRQLVEQAFEGIPLPVECLDRAKACVALEDAQMRRMGSVLRTLSPVDPDEASQLFDTLLQQSLPSLKASNARLAKPLLPFRPDCINTDVDLEGLASALKLGNSARICLFGPPGTGKSEWAKQLGHRLGRPVELTRASDLLHKHIGETEQRIRRCFDRAERSGAILVIDEADSLLHSRAEARASWEVSMVNEMLTSMESFEGIFIASTNLVERLDPASTRRFDFKVRFSALRPEQCRLLFLDLLKELQVRDDQDIDRLLQQLKGATPGDFSTVLRQARLGVLTGTPGALAEAVQREVTMQATGQPGRRIGFL